jgi:hypothetical protein
MSGDYPKSHADLKALSEKLGRPLYTMYALTAGNDPLMAEQPFRVRAGEWATEVYNRLITKSRVHVREIFYKLVSQENPFRENGKPFENTVECFGELSEAIRDARYLGLIPVAAIVDHRNPEPTINPGNDDFDVDAEIEISDGSVDRFPFDLLYRAPTYSLPDVELIQEPIVGQPYHLEIWIEKSTANDILLPLGRRYGINIATFVGEVSLTACKNLIDRVIKSRRPARILHITDFDPAGKVSMTVAAAAKIDYYAKKSGHDLDIRLEHVALTPEQCAHYQLPRAPIKQSERRKANFESSFGTGAAELDALEALHPGALREILVEHIERYYDTEIESEVEKAIDDYKTELENAAAQVCERHASELAAIDQQRQIIDVQFGDVRNTAHAAYNATVEPAQEAYQAIVAAARRDLQAIVDEAENDRAATIYTVRDQIQELERPLVEQAEALIQTMNAELKETAPAPHEFDWPVPTVDEWENPVYDSARSYVEQIDRFRRHQGRDADVRRKRDRIVTKACIICGGSFLTGIAHQVVCGPVCSGKRSQRGRMERLQQARNGKT